MTTCEHTAVRGQRWHALRLGGVRAPVRLCAPENGMLYSKTQASRTNQNDVERWRGFSIVFIQLFTGFFLSSRILKGWIWAFFREYFHFSDADVRTTVVMVLEKRKHLLIRGKFAFLKSSAAGASQTPCAKHAKLFFLRAHLETFSSFR